MDWDSLVPAAFHSSASIDSPPSAVTAAFIIVLSLSMASIELSGDVSHQDLTQQSYNGSRAFS